MKNVLVNSGVVFDEAAHTYKLGKRFLSGITGIIHKYAMPEMYSGIPENVLAKAAERGKEIHQCIQDFVNGERVPFPSEEVVLFEDEMKGTDFIASEYIVTDKEHYASAIDIVDKDFNLYDIKTTSKLNEDYLRWQLSIYAEFFELQNKKKAGKLFAVHIRDGECRKVEVERVPSEWVKRLLECGVTGEVFENPMAERQGLVKSEFDSYKVQRLREVELLIAAKDNELKRLQEEMGEIKTYFKDEMKARGIVSYESENLKISIKAAYTRDGIDTRKLKEESPEVYQKYYKPVNVGESISIKVK